MKSRQDKINEGLIYQVYFDGLSDNVLFEDTRSKCLSFIKTNYRHEYKANKIRLAKLIWESQTA